MKKRNRNILESMKKKRKRNMLEEERSSSMNSVVNNLPESETRDLLSNLPDSLIHHIFSFLDFNDSVRLAAVSTRFRDLSITSPTLSFSLPHHENQLDWLLYPQDNASCTLCKSFISYITKLFHQRQSFPIRRLSFLCSTYNAEPCNQYLAAHQQWIRQAITSFHVEELHLMLTMPFRNAIYSQLQSQWLFSVFNPQCSLKSLDIWMGCRTLKFPKEATLPSLHTLSMGGFGVESSEPIGEWVCKSFPNLKQLSLGVISGVTSLNIRSTCIEDLTIEDGGFFTSVKVYAENLRSFDFRTIFMRLWNDEILKMEFFTPNLEKLRWEGDARRLRWEGEMFGENLQDACFMVQHYDEQPLGKKDFVNNLRGVRCARRLCIDSSILKFLSEEPSNFFENLQHLRLTVGFRTEGENYIFPLLQRAPFGVSCY